MRFDQNQQQTISTTVKVYKGESTVIGLMLNDISMEEFLFYSPFGSVITTHEYRSETNTLQQ